MWRPLWMSMFSRMTVPTVTKKLLHTLSKGSQFISTTWLHRFGLMVNLLLLHLCVNWPISFEFFKEIIPRYRSPRNFSWKNDITNIISFSQALSINRPASKNSLWWTNESHLNWKKIFGKINWTSANRFHQFQLASLHPTETWSDRPLWYHTMYIAIPDLIRDPTYGALMIGSGSNDPDEYVSANGGHYL